MDEKKIYLKKVPAEIIYSEDGKVSISIKTLVNDSSVLNRILKDKVIDHQKSTFNMFVETGASIDTNYNVQSMVWFSGVLAFIDKYADKSKSMTPAVLKELAFRIVTKDAKHCECCARRSECETEAKEQGKEWNPPPQRMCVANIVKFHYDQHK